MTSVPIKHYKSFFSFDLNTEGGLTPPTVQLLLTALESESLVA